MRRLSRTYEVLLAVALLLPNTAPLCAKRPPVAQKDTGYLVLPRLVAPNQQQPMPGYIQPKLYLYRDSGERVNSKIHSGEFPPGVIIPLKSGWYVVRVGTAQAKRLPAYRYFVAPKLVTVIQSGLVAVDALPPAQQPKRDVCVPWNGALRAFFNGRFVARNNRKKVGRIGLIQLHPGRYQVEWHGLRVDVTVMANRIFSLARGYHGPLRGVEDHKLTTKKGIDATSSFVVMCQRDATQLLAGTFWETYVKPIATAPYRKVIWRQRTIATAEGGTYRTSGAFSLRGLRIYRGKQAPQYLPTFKGKASTQPKTMRIEIKL